MCYHIINEYQRVSMEHCEFEQLQRGEENEDYKMSPEEKENKKKLRERD